MIWCCIIYLYGERWTHYTPIDSYGERWTHRTTTNRGTNHPIHCHLYDLNMLTRPGTNRNGTILLQREEGFLLSNFKFNRFHQSSNSLPSVISHQYDLNMLSRPGTNWNGKWSMVEELNYLYMCSPSGMTLHVLLLLYVPGTGMRSSISVESQCDIFFDL